MAHSKAVRSGTKPTEAVRGMRWYGPERRKRPRGGRGGRPPRRRRGATWKQNRPEY
ncbi:hypothetical protein [Haladaptatus halobius]|uniref:hypothetical protein n=1 Tax=Haladaptatus halobius TaxID=2884875 RepID=UPI001D09C489|nr:hypothetical protein [Haladaptatus halobius]